MFTTIGNIIKMLLLLVSLWKERDDIKAQKKAALLKEMVNAFRNTDPKAQASRLNDWVSRINRL